MKNLKKLLVLFLCAVTLFSVFILPVSADTGPKPSVRVNFENMPDVKCYGTLLSKSESTGPYFIWDGVEEHTYIYNGIDKPIWQKFVDYIDKDGYHFLQIGWEVSNEKELAWTYYPPSDFKILLYFPETDSFAVSGGYERYAFDTYYTVNMEGVNIGSVNLDEEKTSDERIEAYRSYQWQKEILSLVARIFITIAIEMLVAIIFGFRNKKQLLLLIAANSATQVLLNVLLNTVNYFSGEFMLVFYYVFFEIIVFVFEAILYCKLMNRFSETQRKKADYIGYSFLANTISFAAGLWLAIVIPGIF